MKENMIMVESIVDSTVVINIPDIPLKRTWLKRGQKLPIDRDDLERAYYDLSVESLFKMGALTTDDKQFLKEVGLLNEADEETIVKVSETYFNRIISLMPLEEVKKEVKKLTKLQLSDLADYAIEHYATLKMDRIDIISKAANRNILKSIENVKADEEV